MTTNKTFRLYHHETSGTYRVYVNDCLDPTLCGLTLDNVDEKVRGKYPDFVEFTGLVTTDEDVCGTDFSKVEAIEFLQNQIKVLQSLPSNKVYGVNCEINIVMAPSHEPRLNGPELQLVIDSTRARLADTAAVTLLESKRFLDEYVSKNERT